MLAVVDAGPLYATADADDDHHASCSAVLARADLRLVVPALVVAEATYFVGRRLGARLERSTTSVPSTTPHASWAPVAKLINFMARVLLVWRCRRPVPGWR